MKQQFKKILSLQEESSRADRELAEELIKAIMNNYPRVEKSFFQKGKEYSVYCAKRPFKYPCIMRIDVITWRGPMSSNLETDSGEKYEMLFAEKYERTT